MNPDIFNARLASDELLTQISEVRKALKSLSDSSINLVVAKSLDDNEVGSVMVDYYRLRTAINDLDELLVKHQIKLDI